MEWESDDDSITTVESPSSPALRRRKTSSNFCLTDDHRRLYMRLTPLISLEASINRELFPTDTRYFNEVCVRAGSGWKATLLKTSSARATPPEHRPPSTDGRNTEDMASVLTACRDDMIALWQDPLVKQVLLKHQVRLEETPGLLVHDYQ
jgi:hypothetical protein